MPEKTFEELWRSALDSCRDDLLPPVSPATGFAWGMLRFLAGQPAEAVGLLTDSAAALPAAKTLYILGLARAETGDVPGALAAFDQTLEVAPDLVPAWYQAAAALRRLGRPADEVKLLERAVENFSGTNHEGLVLNELAIALQRLGRVAEAADAYRLAARSPGADSVACRVNLALLLERGGEREEAGRLLRGVLAERSRRQVPHHLPQVCFLIHYLLGNLELAGSRPICASRHYRRSLAFAPESATAWNALAVACHAAGHRRQAASALRRALAIDPGMGPARRNLECLTGRGAAA